MTDNKIIKALELCSVVPQQCSQCPYYGRKDCVADSANDAIDLIQRQQERIERLKDNLDAVLKERADHTEAIEAFADRIVEQLEEAKRDSNTDVYAYGAYKKAITIVKGVQNADQR